MKSNKHCLAIDIGGTHIKVGVFDYDGHLLEKTIVDSSVIGLRGDPINDIAHWIIDPIINKYSIDAIGIGVPGLLSRDRSTAIEVCNLKILEGVNINYGLNCMYPGVDVFIENDANAGALGALMFDDNISTDTFGFITIGTGIGSAAIINGKLFTGGNGNGLEIGIFPSRNGENLESNIGRAGFVRRAMRYAKEFGSNLCLHSNISPEMILASAKGGDRAALTALEESCQILSECLASFIASLDVHAIYIGGGMAPCFDFPRQSISRTLGNMLSPYYLIDLKIETSTIGNDAGIHGAASLCIHSYYMNHINLPTAAPHQINSPASRPWRVINAQ